MKSLRVVLTLMLCFVCLSSASDARADNGNKGAAGEKAEKPSQENMREARTRYDRGTKLYHDGAYEQALIEFERAYELAPAYRILYNIGQAAMLLRDYP